MTKTTKLFSSIFDLGPLTPKIYSPKLAQDRLYVGGLYDRQTGDVWAHQGVLGDGRFNGTMQMLWGRPLLPWQRNLGYFSQNRL